METDPTFVEYINTPVGNGNANILLSENTLSIVFRTIYRLEEYMTVASSLLW